MLAWIAAHEALLIGVIWMLVLGPAVGNYACSVVYRLPRGQTPFERHPFCGHCNADLKPIDLFPILSWCRTRGKCRYCRGAIPGIYTLIELACAVVFVGYFLCFGVGEAFLLTTSYAVFVIILAAIQWQQRFIAASIYGYAFFCVALLRTWQDATIFGWVTAAFIMLMLALVWQWVVTALRRTEFQPFNTPWIWWMVLMAALVPLPYWKLLLVPAITLATFRSVLPELRPLALAPITAIALYLPVMLF